LYEAVKALGYTDERGWPNAAAEKKQTIDFAFGVTKDVMRTFKKQSITDVNGLQIFKDKISQQALLIPSKWSEVRGVVLRTNRLLATATRV
jgi:hypothetical protein